MDTGHDEVSGGRLPVCKILKPESEKILLGEIEARVTVYDPDGEDISRVVLALVPPKGDAIVLAEISPVPSSGEVVQTVDTRKGVDDGQYSFLCVVGTTDKRKSSASVRVLVDNHAPEVKLMGGSTPPDSKFFNDLRVVLYVSDGGGIGTKSVVVYVDEEAVSSLDKPKAGPQDPIVVPAESLSRGEIRVRVSTEDLVGNADHSALEYSVVFVPPVLFGGYRAPQIPDALKAAGAIAGIKLGGQWMLIAGGPTGAEIYPISQDGAVGQGISLVKTSTRRIYVTDLNGDGLDDIILVVRTGNGDSLVIMTQAQDGLEIGSTIDIGGELADAAFADFDQDGSKDIAVALTREQNSIGVALSAKKQQWSGFQWVQGMVNPVVLAAADLTGDSVPDVVAMRSNTAVATVFPFDVNSLTFQSGINSFIASDEDQDAKLTPVRMFVGPKSSTGLGDRVVELDSGEAALVIMEPSFSGAPGSIQVVAKVPGLGLMPKLAEMGDLDGDGNRDIVVWAAGARVVQPLFGRTPGQVGYDPYPAQLAGSDPAGLALVDYNGDGRLDILALDGKLGLLEILFDSSLPPSSRAFVGTPVAVLPDSPTDLVAGRFVKPLTDTKKSMDIAVLLGKQGNIGFLVPDVGYRLPLVYADSLDSGVDGPTMLLAADLDGNGYDDIAVPSNSSSSTGDPTVGLLLMRDGGSHFKPTKKPDIGGFYAGNSPGLAAVGDIKREVTKPGVLDIATVSLSDKGDAYQMQIFVGNGDGTFVAQGGQPYNISKAKEPSDIFVYTLRGEYNLDIGMSNYGTGDFTVFYAKGLGLFESDEVAPEFAVGERPIRIRAEYLEAPRGSGQDPLPDVVVALEKDVAVYYAFETPEGVTYEAPVYLHYQGQRISDLALDDFNRDGFVDIAVTDPVVGAVYVYLNLANRTFGGPFVVPVGVGPNALVVKDLDGDLCPDIATADAKGNTITVLRNLVCEQ